MTTSALAPSSSHGFASVAAALVSHAIDAAMAVVRAYRHRLDATALAGADDRTLADIGLTRSDLRDAFAEPLWRDPTSLMRNRVDGRRRGFRAIVIPGANEAPGIGLEAEGDNDGKSPDSPDDCGCGHCYNRGGSVIRARPVIAGPRIDPSLEAASDPKPPRSTARHSTTFAPETGRPSSCCTVFPRTGPLIAGSCRGWQKPSP